MSNLLGMFPIPIKIYEPYILNEEENNFFKGEKELLINETKNYSTVNKYILENDKLINLKKYLQDNINDFAHNVYSFTNDQSFYITQSWVNYNDKGTSHHKHNHSNSIFSGVYYIDSNENFRLNLENNYNPLPLFNFNVKEYNYFNSDAFYVETVKNSCVIFPSHIKHFVEENKNDKTRISLAFNVFVKGTIGTYNQSTELKI